MEQVFRIEIPVEVTSNADLGKLKQVEAILTKADQEARKLASAADSAFSRIASGASNAASSMEQMDNAADKSSDAMENVGESADKIQDSAEDAADSVEEIGDAAESAGDAAKTAFSGAEQGIDKFGQRMEKSNRTLRQMFKEKFEMTLNAIDKVSPVVQDVTRKVKSFVGKAWRVTVKMADFVTAPFNALRKMIMSPITMTLSIAGIGLGASSFYQTFTDFTTGMSNVKALSGATEEEFITLKETAAELGATTKFTATEASEGMQYLAMAGWETSEIIAGMPGLLQLAAAGATDLGTAADIVSDVMTAMGMSADQATMAADIFAKTATSTNTTVAMMGETLKYAAPIAHSFGLSLAEVSAITGMMANAGIKGSQAGTAIRSALLRMASPPAEAAKAMAKLGLSFDDGTGKMKDMQTIMRDLSTAFKGLSEQEKLAYADDIFGKNAASGWLAVIEQGADAYGELFTALENSKGAAQEMADIQLDNLAGDVTLLQSAVDGMKVSLMDKISPYLREGVRWLTAKIPGITDALGTMIDKGIQKAKQLKDYIAGVFDSPEMRNADGLAEKLFIAWDKIIAEPFSEWWEGSGREFVLGIVNKIGTTFGEVIHGIIAGVFAAIKGEEIDFEGLNLTGIAKAGAEAAREYVSSFVQGLDAGDLVGSMPGGLKAVLAGFGMFKLGSGALGIVRIVRDFKMAFGGLGTAATAAAPAMSAVGEAAATAGAGAAAGTSAFSALSSTLAAIPGWGWAAMAALVAVGIGIKLYTDKQEEQRKHMLNAGQEMEDASKRYIEAVQRTNDLQSTVTAIQEIKLQMTTDQEANAQTVAVVQGEIDDLRTQYITLQAQLADEFISEEDKAAIQIKIDEIESDVQLKATLDASGYNMLESAIIIGQFNSLTEKEKEIALTFTETTDMTPEEVATLTSNLTELMNVQAEKQIRISGYEKSAAEIEALKRRATFLKNAMADIEIKVEEGNGTQEMIAKYEGYQTELAVIELQLQGKEMSADEYDRLVGQVNDIKTACSNVVLDIAEDSEMTQADVDKIMALIGESGDIRFSLGISLKAGSLNAEQIEELNTQLEAYAQHLEEISGGMIHADEILTEGEISEETQKKLDFLDEANVADQRKAHWDYVMAANEAEALRGERISTRESAEATIEEANTRAGALETAYMELSALQADAVAFASEAEQKRAEFRAAHDEDGDYDVAESEYRAWYLENSRHFADKTLDDGTVVTTEERLAGLQATIDANSVVDTNGAYSERLDQNANLAIADPAKYAAYMVAVAENLSELMGTVSEATEVRDKVGGDLLTEYNTRLNDSTLQAALGSSETAHYAGMSIEELAQNYALLDEAGQKMFEDAYRGLQQLNAEADYISDEEKTQESDIMLAAWQSAQYEANAELVTEAKQKMSDLNDVYGNGIFDGTQEQADAIAAINDALKGFGSDLQIESFDQINEALAALDGVDLEKLDFETAAKSAKDMGVEATTARAKVDAVRTALEKLDGQTYQATISVKTQGNTSGVIKPSQQAEGGIYDGAFLSWVAEDGPEAIIPLGAKRRDRGLDLWLEAGRMLGVNEYAEGGILAPYSDTLAAMPDEVWEDDGGGSGDYKPRLFPNPNTGGAGNTVSVSVSASPEYKIEGASDPEAVMEAIRAHTTELAELLGSEIADQLDDIFSNM